MVRRSKTEQPIPASAVEPTTRRIVGSSSVMVSLLARARRVAVTPTTTLIMGPPGSGKENLAWYIGHHSQRVGSMVVVNCATLPKDLCASELFGHEKGSFTGAFNSKQGLFEAAHMGTIFLDEVAELGLEIQALLLRVLQEKKVRRVGSSQEVPVNVRVVAATNVDLEQAVSERRFREDLFWRLRQYVLQVPPLRERGNDVIEIAQWFLDHDEVCSPRRISLAPTGARVLLDYHWPGNVRELESVLRTTVIDGCKSRLDARHLLPLLRMPESYQAPRGGVAADELMSALIIFGDLSADTLITLTGLGRDATHNRLSDLIAEGRIKRIGLTRSTVYRALDLEGRVVERPAKVPRRRKKRGKTVV